MSIEDLFKLTRFEHSVMLAIAVAIGEFIASMSSGMQITPYFFILSIIPPVLVGAASFVVNDYFDLRSDRINRREGRPLVSGRVEPKTAFLLSMALFLLGIIASAFINTNAFIITLVFSLLAFLYSFKLKDVVLVGNAYIALTMAIPFVYGSFAIANSLPDAVVLLSIIAFVSGLAREIMKTATDMLGDRKGRGSKTLPMLIGLRNSMLVSSMLYILSIALSILPYLYIKPYAGNILYVIPALIADIMLAYIAVFSLKETSDEFMKSSRNISLAAMSIALLGFLVALLAG